MKKYFEIVTLSGNHRRLGDRLRDPVTIITGGFALLSSLFPNLFGGGRKRLSETDWNQLIPGSGFITTALRNYLKTKNSL